MRDMLYLSSLVWGMFLVVLVLTAPDQPPVADSVCLERGYAHHRRIGHWPYLGDGRPAAAEVAWLCTRSDGAYGR